LSSWRNQVNQQNHWRFVVCRFTSWPCTRNSATGSQIATFLRQNLICQGRDLSVNSLKQQILILVHDLITAGKLPQSNLNFTCYTTYMRRVCGEMSSVFAEVTIRSVLLLMITNVLNSWLHFTCRSYHSSHSLSEISMRRVGDLWWRRLGQWRNEGLKL
jgi:hypothetical protein